MLPLETNFYLSLKGKVKILKPRQKIRRFIHSLENWGKTKVFYPVEGKIPVTECRLSDAI